MRVIQRRTMTWRIPPPDSSSSSFEVSAVFWDGNFDDIHVCTEVYSLNRAVKSREISPENLILSFTIGTNYSQCPMVLFSLVVFFFC